MFWISTFLVIIILIGANAIYVMAEFSTVSSRPSRLSQYAEEGNHTAQIILDIVENPRNLDAYVATCQVGITVSSLVLGYYGQAQLSGSVSQILVRLGWGSAAAAESISATVVLIVLSIFQVLLGELVPKNIGIQIPERLSILTHLIMHWSSMIFKPLIWLFNGSGILLMRLFHLEPNSEHTHIHSPEEIAILVEESGAGGAINQEERRLLRNTLDMRDSQVRQIMIPRSRMLAAPFSSSPEALFKLLADSPYSRIPIYKGTIDNIIGAVHLRDLLCLSGIENETIEGIIYPVYPVLETRLVKDVFALLQTKQSQIAVIVDEHFGTVGMVTLEDLLEEIFGDLQDEFDPDTPSFQVFANNQIRIRGDILVKEVNEILETEFPTDEADTIGGLVMNTIGHIPIVNDEIKIHGCAIRVEKMSGRGVALVSLQTTPEIFERVRNLPK